MTQERESYLAGALCLAVHHVCSIGVHYSQALDAVSRVDHLLNPNIFEAPCRLIWLFTEPPALHSSSRNRTARHCCPTASAGLGTVLRITHERAIDTSLSDSKTRRARDIFSDTGHPLNIPSCLRISHDGPYPSFKRDLHVLIHRCALRRLDKSWGSRTRPSLSILFPFTHHKSVNEQPCFGAAESVQKKFHVTGPCSSLLLLIHYVHEMYMFVFEAYETDHQLGSFKTARVFL